MTMPPSAEPPTPSVDEPATTPPAPKLTSIQLSVATRDRLFRLKFRKTYDEFLTELCDLYESLKKDEILRQFGFSP